MEHPTTEARSRQGEADLVASAARGDAEAFNHLVRLYMRRAFAVARRLVGHRQDAEDVVQDAFLAALQKLDTFDRRRPFGPWLLRIVANRALNLLEARAVRRTETLPEAASSGAPSPLDAAERSEVRERLERALARLPAEQRSIVELYELDGFTGPEIAELLGMAEGTVRWHLHQARQWLRAALRDASEKTP